MRNSTIFVVIGLAAALSCNSGKEPVVSRDDLGPLNAIVHEEIPEGRIHRQDHSLVLSLRITAADDVQEYVITDVVLDGVASRDVRLPIDVGSMRAGEQRVVEVSFDIPSSPAGNKVDWQMSRRTKWDNGLVVTSEMRGVATY